MDGKDMRVLWFANTPGLGQDYLNLKSVNGGWITSLQTEVEKSGACKLAYVFYHDQKIDPFESNGTSYFPVQRLGYHKRKRLFHRITSKVEGDENIDNFLGIIEKFKPDIINVYGTENSFGLILDHISNIPVVITIQGNLSVYTKKYFSGIEMPGLFSQLISGNPFFTLDFKQFRKRSEIEKRILKKTKYIFGRTDWDRRICRVLAPDASYFHTEEIMRPKFYQSKWQPLKNPSPVFFTTSSNSPYKGFEVVVDTALLLRGNSFSFHWLLAGLKENDPLVQLVMKTKGVNKLGKINVELLGELEEEELVGKMMRADIYVQVSHIENSPNSICEAMLLGMPIIASFAGGTSSLLRDGETGILVQDGDPFVLAGTLIEMVKSPEYAANVANEAYKVAHQRHKKSEIVSRLLATYNKIIESRYA